MRKVLSIYVFILLAVGFTSCSDVNDKINAEWAVYRTSVAHQDYASAAVALNRISSLEKYNADALDSLSILYGKAGRYESALAVGTKALSVRESDEVMRVVANANKSLGNHDMALEYYKKLLEKTPGKFDYLYDMAFCHINLSQGQEAVGYLQQIISNPSSATAVMREFYQNGSQLVPYRAVAFNMLGFLQTQNGQDQDALNSYKTSLRIFPDYELAKNNLRILNAKMAQQ